MRRLRVRFRLNTPHWPSYPNAVGIILGEFNFCDQKKEGSMCGTKHSPMVTGERPPCFTLFRMQPDYTRRDSSVLGIRRTLSRIDRNFTIYPWLRRETFTAAPMSSRICGTGPFRVITQQHVFSFTKPTSREHQGESTPSWMSKHPLFLFCSR